MDQIVFYKILPLVIIQNQAYKTYKKYVEPKKLFRKNTKFVGRGGSTLMDTESRTPTDYIKFACTNDTLCSNISVVSIYPCLLIVWKVRYPIIEVFNIGDDW